MKFKKLLLTSLALVSFSLTNAQITNPAPYCDATFDDVDGTFPVADHIKEFTLGTFTNTTNAQYAAPHYVFYNNLTIPNFTAGSSYDCTVKMDVHGGSGYGVWIDYNHNNTFEATEKVAGTLNATDWLPITSNTSKTTNITIPSTAVAGNTRVRVRIVEDDIYTGTNGPLIAACNASATATDVMDWGETEDYTINIVSSSVGINDIKTENQLAIYPNPATHVIHISQNVNEQTAYKIYTLSGAELLSGELNSTKEIVISDLMDGIYFIHLYENNQLVGQQKFVKGNTSNH